MSPLNIKNTMLIVWFFMMLFFCLLLHLGICANESLDKMSLVTAVYKNDINMVRKILSDPQFSKKELNPKCPAGTLCKPITFAAKNDSIEIMEMLLNAGADIDAQGGVSGDTPLIISIINGSWDMVELLVKRGANVNKSNNFGATPFWGACAIGEERIVIHFIKNGAKINKAGRLPDPLKKVKGIVGKITPLMISAKNGHKRVVEVLLKNGADLNLRDSLGRSALEYAKDSGFDEIVKMITEYKK